MNEDYPNKWTPLMSLSNSSKTLDAEGEEINKTGNPSQWALSYGYNIVKPSKGEELEELSNKIFEGQILQTLLELPLDGPESVELRWDEDLNEVVFGSATTNKDMGLNNNSFNLPSRGITLRMVTSKIRKSLMDKQ
jgi:hypothetical protein